MTAARRAAAVAAACDAVLAAGRSAMDRTDSALASALVAGEDILKWKGASLFPREEYGTVLAGHVAAVKSNVEATSDALRAYLVGIAAHEMASSALRRDCDHLDFGDPINLLDAAAALQTAEDALSGLGAPKEVIDVFHAVIDAIERDVLREGAL
jgi:hypothetical protein